jgi:hypothetical protein
MQTLHLQADRHNELLSGQLEEIAMCHHAIKAAHHDGGELAIEFTQAFPQEEASGEMTKYAGSGINVSPHGSICTSS